MSGLTSPIIGFLSVMGANRALLHGTCWNEALIPVHVIFGTVPSSGPPPMPHDKGMRGGLLSRTEGD